MTYLMHGNRCNQTPTALVLQENRQTPWAAEGCLSALNPWQTLLGDMTTGSTALWVGALALPHVLSSHSSSQQSFNQGFELHMPCNSHQQPHRCAIVNTGSCLDCSSM